MQIRDILKEKEQMTKEVIDNRKQVNGKNKYAGNFSFQKVYVDKSKKTARSDVEK